MLFTENDKVVDVAKVTTTYASTGDYTVTKINTEKIPNKAFDSEYMTEYRREVKFLASKGIRYTFVKKTPDYGIRQYKYTKTPELFIALAEFWAQIRNEKVYNKIISMVKKENTVSKEAEKEFISNIASGDTNG